MRSFFLIFLLLTATPASLFSQRTFLYGTVRDSLSGQPISSASVLFEKNRVGFITDSSGNFLFSLINMKADSLTISHTGYASRKIFVKKIQDSLRLQISLLPGEAGADVIIKTKINKGLYLWKRVVAKKDLYDNRNISNYSYREYNKITIDVDNFNMHKIRDNFFLTPLSLMVRPLEAAADSAGELPAYIAECISDFSRQNSPLKTYQQVRACNSKGLPVDNFTDILRSLKQKINVYANFIRIMDQDFMSPFNPSANFFYDFSVTDTQLINSKPHYNLNFRPRGGGSGSFEGNAWVEGVSFHLHSVYLKLDKRTKLNFIEGIHISQQYTHTADSITFVGKEIITADFNLAGSKLVKFKGQLSNTYTDIKTNSDAVKRHFEAQSLKDLADNDPGYMETDARAWNNLRTDSLSASEKQSIGIIDEFVESHHYGKLKRNLKFAGTGYWEAGKFDIGKWYSLASANRWEGTRFRLDVFTNKKFSEKVFFHNYLAYGTEDREFKGQSEIYWIPKKYPTMLRFHASWRKDVDNNIRQLGAISADNVFSLAVQKPNSRPRFLSLRDVRVDVYKDWRSGLSLEFIASHQQYLPLMNLPGIENFSVKRGSPLTSFSVGLKLRFSYLDKFVMTDYYKYWIGTRYPEVVFTVEKAIPDIFNSAYSYTRLTGSIGDYFSVAPFGGITYKVFAGKIFGTVPFTFLENHPGNDLYYYGDNVFNMMYRFEYLSDQYAGFRLNHTIGPGIFGIIPFTQKLKWRQLWTLNALWGSLNDFNRNENKADEYFKTLNGRSFMEIGTGVENIFRVFRIDFIWRLSPGPQPETDDRRFGVFGSFKLRL